MVETSHPATHGVRVKVKYTEKKRKSPEARGGWDNLKLGRAV